MSLPIMSQLVQYVKWTDTETEAVHIGALTRENEKTISFLTKYGEMTIRKDDGLFEESTREEFELVELPVKEESTVVTQIVTRSGTKSEKAVDIFINMTKDGHPRKDIINAFKSQLDMSDQGASTYYQNIKKKLSQQ